MKHERPVSESTPTVPRGSRIGAILLSLAAITAIAAVALIWGANDADSSTTSAATIQLTKKVEARTPMKGSSVAVVVLMAAMMETMVPP